MEYTCDECYNLRQKSISKCPLCGKNTFEGRVIGWSSCIKCTNCGMQVVSPGGYPESCHEDDREYSLTIFYSNESAKLVRLAKILNKNVLDLKNEFIDGKIIVKCNVMDCIEKENKISEIGIACKLDDEISKEFPRIGNCPYAHNQYEDWSDFDEEIGIKYNAMFDWFIELFPDDKDWFDNKCKEMDAFPEDGMHVVFGMVVVPYILEVAITDERKMEIAFDFIERMEFYGISKIAEVIEFTVLENLHGADKDKLDLCLKYMGSETKKAFEAIG